MADEVVEANTNPDLSNYDRTEFGNFEANLDFLEQADVLRPGMPILEIGTGTGAMLNHLCQAGLDIRGVEISAKHIAKARDRFGDLPVSKVDGVDLPFDDDSFDAAISFDVIEHIPDPDAHLREMTRVLRPGGRYLIQTPNKWTNTVFETIRHRSLTSWREEHCSLHTRSELVKRFDKHGYDVEFYEIKVVTDFFRKKIRLAMGVFGTLALKVTNPDRWPASIKTNIYLVATRRQDASS